MLFSTRIIDLQSDSFCVNVKIPLILCNPPVSRCEKLKILLKSLSFFANINDSKSEKLKKYFQILCVTVFLFVKLCLCLFPLNLPFFKISINCYSTINPLKTLSGSNDAPHCPLQSCKKIKKSLRQLWRKVKK